MKPEPEPIVSPKLRAVIVSLIALNALYFLWRPLILEPRVVFTPSGFALTLAWYLIVIGRLLTRKRWVVVLFRIWMVLGALHMVIGPLLLAFAIWHIASGFTRLTISVPYLIALGVSGTIQGILSYMALRLEGPFRPKSGLRPSLRMTRSYSLTHTMSS
jgi:hypothetical protein